MGELKKSNNQLSEDRSIQQEDKTRFVSRFGQKVRIMRKVRGLNQTELAERVGTNQATISAIELGKANAGKYKGEIKRVLDLFKANQHTTIGFNGDKLTEIMNNKGINGVELARKCGFGRNTITTLMRNERGTSKSYLEIIAYVLEINPEELVKEEVNLSAGKREISATKEDEFEELRDEISCLDRKINQLAEDKKKMREQIVFIKDAQDCTEKEVSSNGKLIEKLSKKGLFSKIFG